MAGPLVQPDLAERLPPRLGAGLGSNHMVIAWTGTSLETVIYLLCVVTSLLCAYLLLRAYSRAKTRLLIWSALCFGLLAVNNLVVAVDILLLPDIDLTILRLVTSLLAVSVLLYGFIWEVW